MKSMKKALIMALMIGGLVVDSAKAVTVDVTLDQLVLTYVNDTYSTEISSAMIQIGRLGVGEGSLNFSDRASFDNFLGNSSQWVAYGSAQNYAPGDDGKSYVFSANFEPFVQGYGTASESPFQVYAAITSASNLFGLYTWRADDGGVGRFALSADDEPFFAMENAGLTGGLFNMQAVNSATGAVGPAGIALTAGVAVIPEPSAGTLLVCGLGLLMAFRASKIARVSKL